MAKQVTALKIVGSTSVKPSEIKLNPKFKGRKEYIDHDSQITLADSLVKEGQQQPLQVRKTVDGSLEAIFGNSRKLAGDRIEAGYSTVVQGKPKEIPADPDFRLRVEIVECSDDEAFRHVVVENAQRNDTNPIDNMENQEVLRKEQGMSDIAISRLFGYSSQASVTRLRQVKEANFPDHIIEAVRTKNCTLSAIHFLTMAKDVMNAEGGVEAVWKKVKSDGDDSSIGESQMSAAIKEWRKEKAEAAKAATPTTTVDPANPTPTTQPTPTPEPSKQLTVKGFKQLLIAKAGDERCPDKTKHVLSILLSTIDGVTSGDDLVKLLMNELGEQPREVAAVPPPSPEVQAMPTVDPSLVPGAVLDASKPDEIVPAVGNATEVPPTVASNAARQRGRKQPA